MKWDRNRKLQRNLSLVLYRDSHPRDAWREVGEAYGISGQRARQICNAMKRREGG